MKKSQRKRRMTRKKNKNLNSKRPKSPQNQRKIQLSKNQK